MKYATQDQLSAVAKLSNEMLTQQHEYVKEMIAKRESLHPFVQSRIDGMLESVEYEINKRKNLVVVTLKL